MRDNTLVTRASKSLPVLYFALVALYAVVGFCSPGYDDEFFNIWAIEQLGSGVIQFTQTTDVHPPGSYFINWLLYKHLGDWSLVRLLTSIFAASAFVYAIEIFRKEHGEISGLRAFIFLGLNPALLLWCTGIRWYAYFVPIFVLLCVTQRRIGLLRWIRLGVGLILLGYIGYAVFVIAPSLIYLYLDGNKESLRNKFKGVAVACAIAAIGYAYQFHIFLTVHFANKEGQVSSLWRSLLGFAVAQISNQGVFPISVGGILSATGSLGLLTIGFWYSLRKYQPSGLILPYWLGVIGLAGSGLAGKFRNFVIVSPLQSLWFSTLTAEFRMGMLLRLCVLCLGIGNLIGVINVATHNGTTKNSWNLPCKQVLQLAANKSSDFGESVAFLTHDPALTYLLEHRGLRVISPYSKKYCDLGVLEKQFKCVIALKTYAGAIDSEKLHAMYNDLNRISTGPVEVLQFGRDADYKVKQLLDKRYPEYQVEANIMLDVNGLAHLKSWMPTPK